MASRAAPITLNSRRTSPRVSAASRRLRGGGAAAVPVPGSASFGLFVLAWAGTCPQCTGPLLRGAGHRGQECQGEHGQRDVAVPRVVLAHLIVVQPGLLF